MYSWLHFSHFTSKNNDCHISHRLLLLLHRFPILLLLLLLSFFIIRLLAGKSGFHLVLKLSPLCLSTSNLDRVDVEAQGSQCRLVLVLCSTLSSAYTRALQIARSAAPAALASLLKLVVFIGN